MVKRFSAVITFFLTVSTGFLYMNTAYAWDFDMFSFFSKKDKAVPTTVNASVASELKKVSHFPSSSGQTLGEQVDNCIKVKAQSWPPSSLSKETSYIETSQAAYVWSSNDKTIALINNPKDGGFDVWALESTHSLKPIKQIQTNELSEQASKWINYSVVDVLCLPNQSLLVAVNYHDPRPKVALYLYDTSSQNFSLFSEVDANAQDLDKYFEHKQLSDKESIVIYYSETQRKSAEVYHNYYNHIVLFSEQYPLGQEILKLGIDDGNVVDWQVLDKQLLLHTRDNRDHKDPKTYDWSIDLSTLLAD